MADDQISERATIYALATAPGRAGIAIVRISGDRALLAAEALTRQDVPAHRRAAQRNFYIAADPEPFDQGLMLTFRAPQSFTGEDVVECHVHGGPAVIAALLEALASMEDLRTAAPGEFTRRAFEHGKLDLTQAEAIADLINAETEAQRKQALRQLGGDLGALYSRWRRELLASLAHLEAWLDFPEEELEGAETAANDLVVTRIAPAVAALEAEINAHLGTGHRGEIIRNGYHVAILGAPNAGKSTLLNSLAARDVAITSEIAGTTRDVIEVRLDLGGYPVVFSDTAGLREASDEVEAEGVRRAERVAATADLKLLMVSAEEWPKIPAAIAAQKDESSVLIINKTDVVPVDADSLDQTALGRAYLVSAKTGEGLDELTRAISERAAKALAWAVEPFFTQQRHREALEEVASCLTRFTVGCRTDKYDSHRDSSRPAKSAQILHETQSMTQIPFEMLAEDLRLAARALGRITGSVDVDEILDIVFQDFCIGK